MKAADACQDALLAVVVTGRHRVDPLSRFYPAEDYHQDYRLLNPRQPYIVYNDLPKIASLKRIMPEVWRDDPVTLASTRSR